MFAIILEQLGLSEPPKRSDRFVQDLKADSLDIVELVMALEEEFGIEIPDAAAEKMTTVGDAIAFFEKGPSAHR